MNIPTESIGSLPRPAELVEALGVYARGDMSREAFEAKAEAAVSDTIHRLEGLGCPMVTDGEQTKPSFATYPIQGLPGLSPEGVTIPFADGHTRRLPVITQGPFRYQRQAADYLAVARRHATVPVKQAVISASALSLLYPTQGLSGYSRDAFLADLLNEAERDIRRCLDEGAAVVQIDFTEARLALKLDPSKGLLRQFVALNNQVLDRFDAAHRQRIGVHTCPGGDQDSTHSADVDYLELLPDLMAMHVGRFYIQLSSEKDRPRVLACARDHLGDRHLFIGVTDPINPRIESAQAVCDSLLEAARFIPVSQLGSTDDCGFAPFGDDLSTSRDTAFAKIQARLEGTRLASTRL